MIVQKLTFAEIFQLYDDRNAELKEAGAKHRVSLAADMGLPHNRVRQWRNRHFIPPWCWPELVEAIEARFERTITYEQLVEASIDRGKFILEQRQRSIKTRERNREIKAEKLRLRRERAAKAAETRRKNRENAKTDEAA